MRKEFDRHPKASFVPGQDGLAQFQRVPVDDDRGQQVEASDSVMLTLFGSAAQFAALVEVDGARRSTTSTPPERISTRNSATGSPCSEGGALRFPTSGCRDRPTGRHFASGVVCACTAHRSGTSKASSPNAAVGCALATATTSGEGAVWASKACSARTPPTIRPSMASGCGASRGGNRARTHPHGDTADIRHRGRGARPQ